MYSKFNDTALEFLNKLSSTFPHIDKIKEFKLMYHGILLLGKEKPVSMFMENMEPFGLQIMSKNEIFFKNDQYVDMAESISGKLGLIQIWDTTSSDIKEAIWQYIQTLYVLGMNITNKKEDLKLIIQQVNKC